MKASVTIDPRVQSKGSSWLRTLTGSMLGGMAITDEVFIIRDSRQEPAMVLVPYRIYLELQGPPTEDKP